MIEIKPWMVEQQRFLAILIYLPKCTMRMLVNLKIICLDDSFDISHLEKRCDVPIIGCASGDFDMMLNQSCQKISGSARNLGIHEAMSVKEAIACVFQNEL